MRLIDADSLIVNMNKGMQGTAREYLKFYQMAVNDEPIAYDADVVVRQVNSIGKSYCDSVKCDKNCEDCEHGCIMRAITEKVKEGGID